MAQFFYTNVLILKMYVLIFSTIFSETLLTIRINQPDIITNLQYPLFIYFFQSYNEIWISRKKFRKTLKRQIALKYIHRDSSYFMRTDGQTNMTKLTFISLSVANEPTKWVLLQQLSDWKLQGLLNSNGHVLPDLLNHESSQLRKWIPYTRGAGYSPYIELRCQPAVQLVCYGALGGFTAAKWLARKWCFARFVGRKYQTCFDK